MTHPVLDPPDASAIRTSSRVEHPPTVVQSLKYERLYKAPEGDTRDDGAVASVAAAARNEDCAWPAGPVETGGTTGTDGVVGLVGWLDGTSSAGVAGVCGVAGTVGAVWIDGSGTPDTATPPWLEHVPRPSDFDQVPSRQMEPASAGAATSSQPDDASSSPTRTRRADRPDGPAWSRTP